MANVTLTFMGELGLVRSTLQRWGIVQPGTDTADELALSCSPNVLPEIRRWLATPAANAVFMAVMPKDGEGGWEIVNGPNFRCIGPIDPSPLQLLEEGFGCSQVGACKLCRTH